MSESENYDQDHESMEIIQSELLQKMADADDQRRILNGLVTSIAEDAPDISSYDDALTQAAGESIEKQTAVMLEMINQYGIDSAISPIAQWCEEDDNQRSKLLNKLLDTDIFKAAETGEAYAFLARNLGGLDGPDDIKSFIYNVNASLLFNDLERFVEHVNNKHEYLNKETVYTYGVEFTMSQLRKMVTATIGGIAMGIVAGRRSSRHTKTK